MAQTKSRLQILFLISGLAVFSAASAVLLSAPKMLGDEKKSADPWNSAQIVQPAELAQELVAKSGVPPTIVYVGFRTLFAGGHIPGATFHGTTSTEQGLAELKKWVEALSRTSNLVIYCGCCPFEKCPNIRPAFSALNNMGFRKLRVLALPTSFAADWAEKGYPVQKAM